MNHKAKAGYTLHDILGDLSLWGESERQIGRIVIWMGNPLSCQFLTRIPRRTAEALINPIEMGLTFSTCIRYGKREGSQGMDKPHYMGLKRGKIHV